MAVKYTESVRYGRIRLMKREDNGYWYAKYRLPDSPKWIEKSLHTALRRDAEKHADVLNSQIINRSLGVADGTIPVTMLLDKFFGAMRGHLNYESEKRFMSSRHMFERWIAEFHPEVKLVKHLHPSLVREYQAYRVAEGAAKRTVDNDVTNLHTIFRWGEREGLVAKSPFNYSMKSGSVRLYDEPQKKRDTYSVEEYRRLVEEAEKKGDLLIRDMIIVFADTGLRFGELANLTVDALCWTNVPPYIDIRARHGWTPKDPKEQKQIPMTPLVQEVLRRRVGKAKRGLLFPNRNGKVIAENHSRDRLKSLFEAVGISADRRLHWHSWRNYFVLRRLDDGEPIQRIMSWTGHDSESMVIHYAKAQAKEKEGVADFKSVTPS